MRRIVLVLAILPFVLLAGCNFDPYAGIPGADQQAPIQIETVHPGEEGPRDWIKLTKLANGEESYEHDEVTLRVVTPDGNERQGFACNTPEGSWHDGCQDPFSEGDAYASGDELWIPCSMTGNHRVTIELGDFHMIDGPASCEAGAGEEGPEQAEVNLRTHDAEDDGDIDWYRLILASGDNAPYGPDEVRIAVQAPSGDEREDRACTADAGNWDDGCEDPFTGDASWDAGETLYVPCQDSGQHHITVAIRGQTHLDTGFFCDAGA